MSNTDALPNVLVFFTDQQRWVTTVLHGAGDGSVFDGPSRRSLAHARPGDWRTLSRGDEEAGCLVKFGQGIDHLRRSEDTSDH